jgi:alkaline phosphatase D
MKQVCRAFTIASFLLCTLSACRTDALYTCSTQPVVRNIDTVTHFCFASCGRENKPEPILNTIAAQKPQFFLFLGDNIYGDTEDMRVMRVKYQNLACKEEFQNLYNSCPVLAIWDDHDFGHNDSGIDYPKKEESKEVFMDFWHEPMNSPRRSHAGLYISYYYGDSAHRVQLILLDNRTFRTPLIESDRGYEENFDPQATMIGAQQWQWLHDELLKPARVRIIASSTQFSAAHNYWEAWANFPLEMKKMFDVIRDTRAEGVVFLSGDTHFAELSMRNEPGLYPIYDLTASSINQPQQGAPSNAQREIGPYLQENFGTVDINWADSVPDIHLMVQDIHGAIQISKHVPLSELKY